MLKEVVIYLMVTITAGMDADVTAFLPISIAAVILGKEFI